MNHLIKKLLASDFLKSYLIVTLGMAISIISARQSSSQIIFDKQQSQYFGAYNLITMHKALYSLEDKHIRDTLFSENNVLKKTAGFSYLMAKLLLLDAQMDAYVALSQHELFGHGARYREFGLDNILFGLNLYPPFGDGSGFAQWGNIKKGYNSPITQEDMAIIIAEVDGETLLAHNIASQFLFDDMSHYRQGLLYFIAQNNLPLYLWLTRSMKSENISPGNDMVNYMNGINYLYPNPADKIYDVENLSNQSLISFVNPLQLYSVFSIH